MHEAMTPGLVDHRPPNVLTNRKMDVQAVSRLVPFSDPQVREPLAAKSTTEVYEELADVASQRNGIVAP